MHVEIRRYWALVRKWWWLGLACTVLAMLSAFITTLYTTPAYTASATLYVDTARKPSTTDPYGAELFLTQDVETIAKRLVLRPVLEGVIENLGLSLSPGELEKMVAVKVTQRTQLITLDVTDTNPQRAAAIANEIPVVFNKRNRELLAERYESSKSSIAQQMATLAAEMNQVQAQLDTQRSAPVPDTAEITRLENILTQLRNTHASLLQSYESIRMAEASALSNVIMDQPAVPPTAPSSPNKPRTIGLAGAVGLIIAAGVALLIEYLDDTLKTPDDVEMALSVPILGTITRFEPGEQPSDDLVVVEETRSSLTEAFRILRTNIQFVGLDHPTRSLVITSPGATEGKSAVTANLGIALAQAGHSVIVVDADLRRPRQHKLFNLPNEIGLTSALVDGDVSLDEVLQATAFPHLRVLTSGPLPPDPTVVLNSGQMVELEHSLLQRADIVLFDTPPVLMVADSAILAHRADGVLLVLEAGRTRRDMARRAMARLEQADSHLLGAVLNKLSDRSDGYYYYYYYYYYARDGTRERRRRKERRNRHK